MTRFVPAAFGLAIAAGATAHLAGATTSRSTPEGRVVGTFFMEGGVAPGNVRHPIPGTITLEPAHGAAITIKVGNNGEFSAEVPDGTYTVSGQSPRIIQVSPSGKQTESTCRAATPAVVTVGHTTTTSVGCYVA